MKKKGCTSDYTADRNRELHRNFLHILRTARDMPLREMFGAAASCRASRFWVSERRAADVIGRMLRGDRLENMLPKRREMFEEICRRVRAHMAADPTLCMTHAVDRVVFEEAPEFYMTSESVRTVIYKMRARARAVRRLRAALSPKH